MLIFLLRKPSSMKLYPAWFPKPKQIKHTYVLLLFGCWFLFFLWNCLVLSRWAYRRCVWITDSVKPGSLVHGHLFAPTDPIWEGSLKVAGSCAAWSCSHTCRLPHEARSSWFLLLKVVGLIGGTSAQPIAVVEETSPDRSITLSHSLFNVFYGLTDSQNAIWSSSGYSSIEW